MVDIVGAFEYSVGLFRQVQLTTLNEGHWSVYIQMAALSQFVFLVVVGDGGRCFS